MTSKPSTDKKGKKIDIENYDDFIEAGFKECPKCGWAFAPGYFKGHECPPKDMPPPGLKQSNKNWN